MNALMTSTIVLLVGSALALPAHAGPTAAPLDFDPTFAGDGTLIIEPGTRAVAYAGMIDEAGEILVFGEADNGNASFREAWFHRILGDGTVVPLGRFGAESPGCGSPRAFLTGIRLSNGDYLGGGYVQEGCTGLPRKFNVLQLTPSGGLVEEFDRVQFFNQLAYINALGEQSDGSIIAAGFASTSGSDVDSWDIAVARFNTDGTQDASFGTNGIFVFDRASDRDQVDDLIIDEFDRILIAGTSSSSNGDLDIAALRLTPDGALDTSFGGTGTFFYDGGGFNDAAASIDLISASRILVGGTLNPTGTAGQPTILGLNEAGELDNGFGNGGVLAVDLGANNAGISDILYAGFRIYVAGTARIGGPDPINLQAAVTVLRSDGSPNPFFNGGQPQVFEFDPALGPQSDIPQSIDVSDDGEQIVVTGFTDNTDRTRQRFGIARFIGRENALFIDGFEGGTP